MAGYSRTVAEGKSGQGFIAAWHQVGRESPCKCDEPWDRPSADGMGQARDAAANRPEQGLKERAGVKANGAGIAADPTLTGAWMTPLVKLPAHLQPHLPGAMLGTRCLASDGLRLAAGIARDLSPALAPASGLASGWLGVRPQA
jgi:hypothetical protein